jgi:hypothetical protein
MTQDRDIWEGDLLGREAEGLYLERYFENIFKMDAAGKSSFVLNINSEWGHGKTWFLKRFSEQLGKNHPVVYFDAWKNDFTKDALLSFVSVICADLSEQFKNDSVVKGKIDKVIDSFSSFAKKAVPIVAAVLVKQATGMASDSFVNVGESLRNDASDAASNLANVAATSIVEEFSKKKSAIESFESSIKSLIEEIKKSSDIQLPIFVFVDELDRCRPTYAIELLESIKHLFSVVGVFFVIATDTKQLSHSIKAVYGHEFNSISYLKRFFYAEYQLTEPNYKNMSDFLFDGFDFSGKLFMPESLKVDYGFSAFFSKTAEFFKLTARDQEQVFSILKTVLLTSNNTVIHYILMLYLICLKHKFGLVDRQWKHIHFIDENILSGQLKNVMISAQYWGDIGSEKKDTSLKEVFSSYLGLLDDDLSNIGFPSHVGRYFQYKEQVVHKLRDGKERTALGKYFEKNDLGSYFELTSQAGRMVVNV